MSDEKSEYLRVMELQRTTINLLEESLDNMKAAYQLQRERAEALKSMLIEVGGCPGCEPREEKTELELKQIYGIV